MAKCLRYVLVLENKCGLMWVCKLLRRIKINTNSINSFMKLIFAWKVFGKINLKPESLNEHFEPCSERTAMHSNCHYIIILISVKAVPAQCWMPVNVISWCFRKQHLMKEAKVHEPYSCAMDWFLQLGSAKGQSGSTLSVLLGTWMTQSRWWNWTRQMVLCSPCMILTPTLYTCVVS